MEATQEIGVAEDLETLEAQDRTSAVLEVAEAKIEKEAGVTQEILETDLQANKAYILIFFNKWNEQKTCSFFY